MITNNITQNENYILLNGLPYLIYMKKIGSFASNEQMVQKYANLEFLVMNLKWLPSISLMDKTLQWEHHNSCLLHKKTVSVG